MKEEHETAIKANEAAFQAQEVTLKTSIERLEKALNIAEDALHEAKEVNKSMATRHEIEIRAARGLIRAERELGRSEASKYRASRDLQRMHLATLRSELALAKVTSGERLSFLEDQLKAICASYSERIVKERAEFAATRSRVREPVAGLIQDSDSTTQDEFLSKIAEIRAEAEVEISSLVAKYDSAMRGAAGERRALKALLDSEMNKASPGRNIERGAPVERAAPVTSVVDVSAQANDAIRDAQIQFEQRVAALKKAHNEEMERVKASNASKPNESALSADEYNAALREEQIKFEQRVVALKKAHNKEIERVKAASKSQAAVSPVEIRKDVDVDAVREEAVKAVRGVAGERRALKSMFDSEMRKASERALTRLQSEVAISEVSSSKKMNDAIRDVQIQFEQRVAALKKAHNEEMERVKASNASKPNESALSADEYNAALREEQIKFEQRVVALKKAHNKEIERVKAASKSQAAVSPVEIRKDVDVDAVREEAVKAVRGVAGERRALKSMFDSEMRKASERALTRLQSEVAISEVSSSKKMNDAIRDVQIQFEQRVAALKKAHNEELERLKRSATKDDAAAKIKALEQAHQMAIQTTAAAHATALEDARRESDRRVTEAEDRARDAISKLNESEALKAQLLAQFEAERINIKSNVASEQDAVKQDVTTLKEIYDDMLVRAVAEIQSLAEASKVQLESALKSTTGERNAMYRMMRAEAVKRLTQFDANEEIMDLKKQLSEKMAIAEEELVEAVAELKAENEQLEASLRASSSSTAEARVQLNDAIRDAQIQFEQRVVALKKAHNEEIERVQAASKASTPAVESSAYWEQKIKNVELMKDAQLKQLKQSYEQKIADLQASSSSSSSEDVDAQIATLNKQLEDAQRDREEAVKRAVAEIVADKDRLQAAVDAAKSQLDGSLRELEELKVLIESDTPGGDVSAEVTELQRQLRERAEVERDLRNQIASAQQYTLPESITYKFEDASETRPENTANVAALKAQIVRLESQLTEMQKTKREYDAKIESLKASARAAPAVPAAPTAGSDESAAKDAVIADLKKQLSEQAWRLQEQKAIAEEQLVEAVAELKAENEQLETSLRAASSSPADTSAQVNDAIRDAQIQFEQRVVALKKAHNEEIERVQAASKASSTTGGVSDRSAEIDALNKKLQDAENDAEAQVKAAVATILADNAKLQEAVAAEKAQLDASLRELEELKASMSKASGGDLSSVVSDLQAQLSKRSSIELELRGQLDAAKAQLESLKTASKNGVKYTLPQFIKYTFEGGSTDDKLMKAQQAKISALESQLTEMQKTKREYDAKIESLKASARAAPAVPAAPTAGSDESAAKDAVIADLKKQLSEQAWRLQEQKAIAEEQLVEAVAELKAENEQLETSLRAASSSPADTSAQVNDAIRDAQIQFEQRVVALKKAHNEEIERVQAASKASSTTGGVSDRSAEIDALNKKLQDAENDAEAQVKAAVATILADNAKLQEAVAAEKAQLDASLRELEELKASMSKASGGDLSSVVSDLQAQLSKRSSIELELRGQLDAAKAQLESLKTASKNGVKYTLPQFIKYTFEGGSTDDKLMKAQQAKISALESQLTEMQKTKREYDAKIESLKASARAAPAVPAAPTAGSDESAAKDAVIADLKKQLSEQAWRLQEQKAIAEEQLVEAVAELKAENEQLETSLRAASSSPADTSAQVNDAIRDAQIQFEQRVVALKKAHNEEIERVQAASKASSTTGGVSDRSAEIDALNKKLQDAENDAEAQVKAAVATILADNAKLQEAVAAEKAQLDASLRELEELKASMSKASGGDLSSVVSDLQAQLSKRSSIELELRGQLDAAKAQLESLKTASKNGVKYTLPQFIKYTFEGGSTDDKLMKAQQAKISALESQLTEMQKTKREYDAKIESLKASARAAPAVPAAPTAGSDESAAKDAVIADLKKQLSEQAWRLQEQKAIAEEQLVEAVAELKAENEQLETSLRAASSSPADTSAQVNDAIRDAQIQFEQRVVALKKAHNEEIERVQAASKASSTTGGVSDRSAEIDALNKKLQDAENDAEAQVKAAVATILADNAKLQEAVAAEKAQLDASLRELEELKASMSKASGGDLSSVVSDLQAQLSKRSSIELELRGQLDAAKAQLESLKTASKNGVKYTLPQFIKYTFEGGSTDDKLMKAQQAKISALESQLTEMQKTKREYDAKIESLKASARAAPAVPAAPTAGSDESAAKDAVIADLKKQLSEQAWRLQEQKAIAEEQLVEAVASIQAFASSELAQRDASSRSSAGERRALYAMMRNEAIKQSADAMVEFTAEVATAEAQSSIFWEQKIREVEAAKDAQIDRLKQEYQGKIDALQSSTAWVSSDDDEMKKIKAQLAASKSSESELRKRVESTKKDLEDLKQKSKGGIKYTLPQTVTYKFTGNKVDASLEKERDALQAQVTRLESQLDEMQKSKRLYEQTIANMKSTSKTDTETATIDDQVAALKKQLADANESAERELIQAVAEIQASAEADRVALVALVKSEADDRVSQESKLFQEEKEALITAQTLEIETLQNAMKTSLASDETTKVKQAEDLWKAKLEEVERSAKIQADEIAAEYEATVKRLELQLEEVSEGYESTIKKLNKTLKRTATETEAELRLEVTEARKELDAFKRKQQQKREKSVVKYTLPQSVTYKFEGSTGEVKRLKKQRDALQEKLEKLEAEFATQAKRSSPDVEKHIFDLEAQIKAVRAERDQDVLSVTTRLQSEKLDSERRLEKELEKARKGMQKAEEKYKAVLDKAKGDRGGIFASIIGASQGQDASLDAVNAQIKDQTVLLSAAETEARDAQEREVKLREEISRLTLEFEQKSSASADEIAALKAELKDAVSNASSTFAAESETTVKEYKQRISELESKLKSGDDTVAAIAKLQADAQEQLAVTVARLNEERERAVADAETKYALDLARLTENASASFDEDDEMTAAVAQMLRKMAKLEQERDAWQFDSVAWKDQAKSYEANVRSLESERADILVKYQNSQAMLGSRISEMNAMKEKHNDEIVRAVAQTMADADFRIQPKDSRKQGAHARG